MPSRRTPPSRDTRNAPFVAIVNQALVRAAFGAEDPIGRRIQCGLDSGEFMTIVGVVGDVRTTGPAIPAEPEILMPYEQHPGPATALNLIVRSETVEPLALAETIRRVIARRSADVPVKVSTMEGRIETATATPRFRTFLVVVFAGVALVLAMAGVYSVMAYTVSQRIPELGVRIALGATPASIMRLILAQGGKLAAAGLALGLARAVDPHARGAVVRRASAGSDHAGAGHRRDRGGDAARDLHPGPAGGPGRPDDRAESGVRAVSHVLCATCYGATCKERATCYRAITCHVPVPRACATCDRLRAGSRSTWHGTQHAARRTFRT